MSRRRWMLAGLGAVAALGALFLLAKAVQPPSVASAPSTSSRPNFTQSAEEDDIAEATLTWRDVSRGDGVAPERPIRSMPPSLNPFIQPPASTYIADDDQPQLRLEGIARGASTVALISGRRVRVGESIEGFELLEVSGRRAELFAPNRGHLHLVLEGPHRSEAAEP